MHGRKERGEEEKESFREREMRERNVEGSNRAGAIIIGRRKIKNDLRSFRRAKGVGSTNYRRNNEIK